MAKKITLTVPESLSGKIEQWRSSFNLSKLFQDAVAEAIRKKEELQRRLTVDHSLDDVVARLKAEKRGRREEAAARGRDDGFAWAKGAHYSELVRATARGPVASAPLSVEAEAVDESWRNYRATWPGRESASSSVSGHEAVREDPAESDARLAYGEGWQAGVLQLWELVKDRLSEA